jgi:putative addiction module component (TIGR02574 family)
MPITLDQIVEEIRDLPVEVVAELVDRIMLNQHGGIEEAAAAAWKPETDRRIAQVEAGGVKGIPLEESQARARANLGQ